MLLVEVSQNATGDDSAPGPPPAGGIELLERLIICSIWICALRQQPRDETRKFLRCRFHAPDSLADFSFLNYQDPNCVPCAIRAGAPGGKVEILDDLRGRPASAIATQFLPACLARESAASLGHWRNRSYLQLWSSLDERRHQRTWGNCCRRRKASVHAPGIAPWTRPAAPIAAPALGPGRIETHSAGTATACGSITATPSCVGNHSLPSRAFTPAGQ